MPIVYEGVEYCNFIKWYRDNKKRLREFEMEEIRLSPLTVIGIPKSDLLSPEVAAYMRKGIVSLSELVCRKMNTSLASKNDVLLTRCKPSNFASVKSKSKVYV